MRPLHRRHVASIQAAADGRLGLDFAQARLLKIELAERLGKHTEHIIRDVRDGTLSADFAIPAGIRAELQLQPDPERAHHLEQAAALGDGVLRPGLAWPELAVIGCWKGGTVASYLTQFETYFPQRPPVRDLGYLATELSGSVPLTDEGDAGVVATFNDFERGGRRSVQSVRDPDLILQVTNNERVLVA